MFKRIAIGLVPVIVGGLIYITYRTESLFMFRWFDIIGVNDLVYYLRGNSTLHGIELFNWLKYSLPDALWVFSFTYIMLVIWRFQITSLNLIWIFIAPAIGIFSELGQLLGLVRGTFDVADLLLIFIAVLIPFLKLKQITYAKLQHN